MHSRIALPRRLSRSPDCSYEIRERNPGLSEGAQSGLRHGSILLYPELIHAGKGPWVFRLELLPKIEVGHGRIGRKSKSKGLIGARMHLEAEKFQAMLAQKGLDLGNGKPVLLHVEQEIATFTDAEEIRVAGYRCHRRIEDLAAAAADLIGAPSPLLLG